MVKAWVLGAVVVLMPAVASAQAARTTDNEQIRGRQKISIIEGMFERAVQNGVDNFSRQLQAIAPNADGMAMLMGAPQVRGFRMEEPSGVFFDVLMPSLQLSMVWPLRAQVTDPRTIAMVTELRSTAERVTDPQTRLELMQTVRDLEQQLSPGPNVRRRGPQTQVANVQGPPTAAQQPPVSPADLTILDDPAEAWRREVRATLIDAMIENGPVVGPDDYVIVAARGVLSTDRLVSDAGDARTVELKLKGSDLAAFRSNAITLEEARKRVRVREY